MKNYLIIIPFLFCLNLSYSQDFKNINFLDRWHEDSLTTNSSKVRYSGCWGFEREGKEYAVIGSTEGTHFFMISDNGKLLPSGYVEGRFNSSSVIHREIKTFGNYAYAVCDEGSSSLQIIDLSYLPDSVVKVADLQDERFGKIHNLFIDSANQLLYACLVTPFPGGNPTGIVPMRVFSLSNPLDPQLLWQGPSDIPEVHDCYVRDNKAILNCGMDGIRVYDFSNPVNPVYLSNLTFYQDQGYNHQGWLASDGRTYVFADETNGKKIKKCELKEDHSLVVKASFGTAIEQGSVPHNIMCTEEFAFVAYYNEGLRVFDLRYPIPKEIAHYDTYPDESAFKMNGAWGVYSEYKSGRLIISDRQYGLFLFKFDKELFQDQAIGSEFSVYPNPTTGNGEFVIRSEMDDVSGFEIELVDMNGKILYTENSENNSFLRVTKELSSGIYLLRIRYEDYLGETSSLVRKVLIEP
jgi:choice-of-anchor B domain-containing protein